MDRKNQDPTISHFYIWKRRRAYGAPEGNKRKKGQMAEKFNLSFEAPLAHYPLAPIPRSLIPSLLCKIK